MSVQLRGKKIAVEKLAKSGGQNGLFSMPEDTTSCGIITHIGPEVQQNDLKVGMKVYFGDKRQQVRIEGKDLQVMEEDNVLAVATS